MLGAPDYLDRVGWRVTLAAGGDITPATWGDPATWAWAGYGYAFPGGPVEAAPGGGVRVHWNETPDQEPGGNQMGGVWVGADRWVVGNPYEVTVTMRIPVGAPRVRATVGFMVSSAWAYATDEVVSATVVFTPSTARDYLVGVEGPPGEGFMFVDVLGVAIRPLSHDITDAVYAGVTVNYGAPAWMTETEPASMSMTVDPARMPAGVDLVLGSHVAVSALVEYAPGVPTPPSAEPFTESRRFTGRVTGITYQSGVFTVSCAGLLERLARQLLGGDGYPEQTETERMSAVLRDGGLPYYVKGVSRFRFVAAAPKATNGLNVANDYATQGGMLVTETRHGMVVAYSSAALDAIPGVLGVDATLVPVETYAATQMSGDVVNRVFIQYGVSSSAGGVEMSPGRVDFPTLAGTVPQAQATGGGVSVGEATWANPTAVTYSPPQVTITGGAYSLSGGSYTPPILTPVGDEGGGGGKPTVSLESTASIGMFGVHDGQMDTDLMEEHMASALATRVLDIKATPSWELTALEIDAHLARKEQVNVLPLMDLSVGQALTLDARPAYSPIPGNYVAIVLGWSEVIGTEEWSITYTLGRFSHAVMGLLTWGELNTTVIWTRQTASWQTAVTISNMV